MTGCGAGSSGSSGTDGKDTVTTAELLEITEETAQQLQSVLASAEEVGPGSEWSIIALKGAVNASCKQLKEVDGLVGDYQDNLRLQVKKADGVLNANRPTDNAKAIIALQMIGGDPADVEGYDLLKQQEDVTAVQAQGINAEIWALIAASSCGRTLNVEDVYLKDILRMQTKDGSITYDGSTPDVDITAMAIQALAPYIETNDDIADAVEAARQWLSEQQKPTGDYGNSESTSQVILALAALGDNPAQAEGFIKEGGNLLDGQMIYHREDGFCHLDEETMDVMATEQALCALDAALLIVRDEQLF